MSKRKEKHRADASTRVSDPSAYRVAGMMGLAVDLGWAYFTQRAAQAAADDAALSSVQAAYGAIVKNVGIVTAFTSCGGTTGVTCATTPVSCDPASSALGNLQHGCMYARNDGFVPGGHSGRQNVLIEANVPPTLPDAISTPPSPPKDMVYWVTVRTYESIPTLFSSMVNKNNTNTAIAAVGTAAIAAKIIPGSFWGMNKRGDCQFSGGTAKVGFTYTGCGVDIDVKGNGSGASCGAGLPSAYLCAPSGIILSSTCANNGLVGCGSGTPTATGNNYAGQ